MVLGGKATNQHVDWTRGEDGQTRIDVRWASISFKADVSKVSTMLAKSKWNEQFSKFAIHCRFVLLFPLLVRSILETVRSFFNRVAHTTTASMWFMLTGHVQPPRKDDGISLRLLRKR